MIVYCYINTKAMKCGSGYNAPVKPNNFNLRIPTLVQHPGNPRNPLTKNLTKSHSSNSAVARCSNQSPAYQRSPLSPTNPSQYQYQPSNSTTSHLNPTKCPRNSSASSPTSQACTPSAWKSARESQTRVLLKSL